MTNSPLDELKEKLAEYIYEATRVEAEWSKRPIVPELWENRDDKFRKQFVDIIAKYMSMDKLPTPAEAHESWNQSYYKMGWKYGEVRDVEAKTHPDLLPFDELSQPERDKDAIFLAFVWLATQLNDLTSLYCHKQVIEARIDQVHKDLGGLPLTMPIKSMRNRNTAFKRYGVKMFNTKIKERREAQLAKLRKTL